jgi:hypothetical protein
MDKCILMHIYVFIYIIYIHINIYVYIYMDIGIALSKIASSPSVRIYMSTYKFLYAFTQMYGYINIHLYKFIEIIYAYPYISMFILEVYKYIYAYPKKFSRNRP